MYSGESLLYSNNTVTGFDDRAHMIYGNAMIERNTFVANNDCLIIHEATYTVKNNYFARNWVGVRPVYGDTVIQNNAFSDNTYSISTMASSSSIIYNNFYGSSRYCIQTQANYVQGYFDYSNPLINDNNFYAINQIIISIKPDSHPGYFGSGIVGVVCNIDATRNYWAASNINDVILDNNDGIEEIAYMVNYLPVATNQIAMAGIQ